MPVENPDYSLLRLVEESKERQRGVVASGFIPTGGGSGGPPQDPGIVLLTARVDAIEKGMTRIDLALATMTEQLRHLATAEAVQGVRTEIATLSGKIDGKAAATDLSELKGRVGRIPTVSMLASLIAIATAFLAAWPWIKLHLIG